MCSTFSLSTASWAESSLVHLLPILALPILAWLYWSASKVGLNAEVPVAPQARVSKFASRALADIKEALVESTEARLEGTRLLARRAGQDVVVWDEEGTLHIRRGGQPPSDAPLGWEGCASFQWDSTGGTLVCQVTAREDGAEKTLTMRLLLRESHDRAVGSSA